jgi:hypothetical protein
MEVDSNHAAVRYKALVQTLHHDLHALCQPLTALQCVLELGRMGGGGAGLMEAVDCALEETRRMFAVVSRMRSTLREEDAAAAVREPFAGPLN